MYTFENKQVYEITAAEASKLLGEVALLFTADAADVIKQRDDFKCRINTTLNNHYSNIQVDVFVNASLVDDPNDFAEVKQLFLSTQKQNRSAEKAFEEFCKEIGACKFDAVAKRMFLAGWSARAICC